MKKLASNLAGFILIMAIFVFSFITSTKKFLTVENLSTVIKAGYEASKDYSEDYFIKMINGNNSKDYYNKYFDNDEIAELYIDYYAQYVLYINGVPDVEKPEFNELKNKVDGYIEDYQTETGMEPENQKSFNFFYNLDENMAKTAYISKKVKKVVNFVYNKNVRDITVAIMLVCIVIIILLNRNITQILLHISSVFISNGIGILIIKTLIDKHGKALTTNTILLSILEKLSTKFTKLCIIAFAIGFGALLLFILIKIFYRRKEKPAIAQITSAQIPTMNQGVPAMVPYSNNDANHNIYSQDSLGQLNNMGQKKE